MEVIADWIDLKIRQYEDGKFEGYEALGDQRMESGDFEDIKEWAIRIIEETADLVKADK